jgi:putative OPT family oligopeptide transporter
MIFKRFTRALVSTSNAEIRATSLAPLEAPLAQPLEVQPKLHAEPEFQPFISPERVIPEFTPLPLAVGALLGVIFAWSSAYLGLKVGQTVSASIPVAVLSITIFRWASRTLRIREATILENNMAQTVGSAGESLAAGIVFTLPSLLLMGHDMELGRVLLVALLGGLIGVLMMIPMRHGLIVEEHGKLTYPEGTACADLLIVGETGGTSAKTVFVGFFVGAGYAFLNLISKLWEDTANFGFDFWGKLKGATLSFEVSPPMLGVGYIIGPRIAALMMAGGALGFLILVPMMHLFGDSMPNPMYPETVKRIVEMNAGDMRDAYIRYVGAGAVATGGFISLARGLPTIIGAFKGGLRNIRSGMGQAAQAGLRTRQDLPMTVVLGGSLALALAIWLAPMLEINFASAVLIVLFGFFFVTVSSRVTGEIGSSSNPISGMTVATLLITCGLFVAVGWTGTSYKAMALTTAALVCVAASNGGTISQDLKTGFLVGATPRYQQMGIGIGVVTSAIVLGFVVQSLNAGNTTYRPIDYPSYAAVIPANAKTQTGPDGQTYRVNYVPEDVGGVPRGKYLADQSGHLRFLIDPGIAGGFPYRIEKATLPGIRLPAPADAPREMGLDRQMYSVVDLSERQGEAAPGRYLVSGSGEIAYSESVVKKFPAPQAQLFRLIIDGTLGGKLPWGLVIIGVLIALMMELVGVPSLPFAVGLYLPLSTSAGVFVGGVVRALVDRTRKGESSAESEFSPGMLMASGLIAGGAITGVIQSGILMAEKDKTFDFSEHMGALGHNETWWPMVPFVLMALSLYWVGTRKDPKPTA